MDYSDKVFGVALTLVVIFFAVAIFAGASCENREKEAQRTTFVACMSGDEKACGDCATGYGPFEARTACLRRYAELQKGKE